MKIISFILILNLISSVVHCDDLSEPGPVQLLQFDQNNNHTVVKGSIERLFLNPLVSDRDVVVVSIAGAFRKGKSFLLNFMLRYLYSNYKSTANPEKIINETSALNWIGDPNEPLKGFPWKSSTKRETTGIIFWSDIFLYDAPNGDRIAIYLMDTQGLFDHNSSPTDNIRIFSLSALVSSVQLINIFSMIEESHLEYLQFATEIARFTAVESSDDFKPFQKLMFLIRDWISPEEYAYGLQGGNKFIKMFLRIKDFQTAELKTVREYLQNTFESITCFLMPYPGKSTARNSSFDGRWSAIEEEFVDSMHELIPIILSPTNLTVKTMNGVPIKAFELSVYIKQYVDLFKSENLPEAKSIYESTLDNQFQILMSKAVDAYLQSISLYQDKIQNKSEVLNLHKVAKALALKYFDEEKKFGKAEDGLVYQKQLEDKLERAYNDWMPVTTEFLEKIGIEQAKTNNQKQLVVVAGDRNKIAQETSKQADDKYEDLQKQIAKARNDTEEYRREAAIIRKRLDQAEKERQEARLNEQEARQHLHDMKQKADNLEQQLLIEKQNAAKRVNERVDKVRKRDGVLKWFGDSISGFFAFIGSAVNRLFGQY